MDVISSEHIAMYAYRILGTGFLVRLAGNVTNYGWRFSGMIWPLVLAVALFSLGAVPESRLRQSGEWTRRYFGILAVAVVWSSVVAPWL